MANYGRNFEFRAAPRGAHRGGRYYFAGETNIPIGAPVKYDASKDENELGLLPVVLATGDQARPFNGMGGVVVFEHAPAAFTGYDEAITTYSDIDFVPAGKAVQVVSGTEVKVVLRNTEDRDFLGRAYDGRLMVAGAGATPTVAVGNYLTPGTGNDGAGYWAETATAANAWLVVTKVDTARGEVEAKFVF